MTALLCLPPRIPGEDAARHFGRPRLANLYGLAARPVQVVTPESADARVLPFVERLWMPAYAVRLRTVTRGRPGSVWTSVDAWAGQFAVFECVDELAMREVSEDSFPPSLGEEEAGRVARQSLLQYILRRRGQMGKPVIEGVEETRLYHYPLWVLYYRRRGLIDLKVLDGYTGSAAGSKLRVAVVNALVAARKQKAL